MRRLGPLVVVALAAGMLGAGCGGPAPTTAPAYSMPAPSPTTATTASPTRPSSEPSLPSPSSSIAPGAVEDPALIAVLPADLDGNQVMLESQAFLEAMADSGFAMNIEAAAFGVVVAGNDLASAVVAKPVDGVFSDAWFRDWRDSYNEGACAQSGGVARNAETDIDGRTVYIGTCSGGLRTYHTWLEDRGLLVSAFSIGEGRFGERLMAGLRP
jgi:hypothetical protein